jgi:hypothetical protein
MWLSKEDDWCVSNELLELVVPVPVDGSFVEFVIACEKRARISERDVWKTLF